MLLREGVMIRGTYEVEKYLGEGAFAEVYRVKHRFLGLRQAMKVFKMGDLTLEEMQALLVEPNLLARLEHPNIVRVFDANLAETAQGERAFFTMGYVAGGSLERFWRSYGRAFVPVETSVDLICQVCNGLMVAHRAHPAIVHRDVKPQNILVGYDSGGLRAQITDFGLAKRVNPMTLMVSARGTRRFKAPEVYLDPQGDSCAGDVWAIGCTLYLLLTDLLPYEDVPDDELNHDSLAERVLAKPSSINRAVDPLLDKVVEQALAFDPDDRFADAGEMLSAIQKWRPKAASKGSKAGGREGDKSLFGPASGPDIEAATDQAERAIRLSRIPGRLAAAADMMEEAILLAPSIRERYTYFLTVWKSGKVG